jgi:hypothetical protein
MSLDSNTAPVGGGEEEEEEEEEEQPPPTSVEDQLVSTALAEASIIMSSSSSSTTFSPVDTSVASGMKRSATALEQPPEFDKVKAKAEHKLALKAARTCCSELRAAELRRRKERRSELGEEPGKQPEPVEIEFLTLDGGLDFRELDAHVGNHPWRAAVADAYNGELSADNPNRLTTEQVEDEKAPEKKRGKFDTGREGWTYADSWSPGQHGSAKVNAEHHFAKHGHEFPFGSVKEYTQAAMDFWFANKDKAYSQGLKFATHNYDPQSPGATPWLVAWNANNKLLTFHTLNEATIRSWGSTSVEAYLAKVLEDF